MAMYLHYENFTVRKKELFEKKNTKLRYQSKIISLNVLDGV